MPVKFFAIQTPHSVIWHFQAGIQYCLKCTSCFGVVSPCFMVTGCWIHCSLRPSTVCFYTDTFCSKNVDFYGETWVHTGSLGACWKNDSPRLGGSAQPPCPMGTGLCHPNGAAGGQHVYWVVWKAFSGRHGRVLQLFLSPVSHHQPLWSWLQVILLEH